MQIKYISFLFLVVSLVCVLQKTAAQDDKKSDRQRAFIRDSIPELNLNRDTTKAESKRKAKAKKRIF